MATPLINVSNRLPVAKKDGEVTRSSGGLVAALEGLPREQFHATWIGWPGTAFAEEKSSSLVWHYRKADEEFGAWKANRLTQELAALTANHPIKVLHGKKMVEVTAVENNKGAIVARVVEQNNPFDAICCAGDDLTDETMFELRIPNLYSIKVGSGPSQAQFRVQTPQSFRELLNRLSGG